MLKEFILLILFICLIPFICLGVLTFLLIKLVFLLAKNILQFFKTPKTFCSKKSYPTKIMFIVNFGLSNILTYVTILYIKKKQFIHLVEDVGANFKYKQNNNLLESVHIYDIYDIFALVGIITLLIILPIYILNILDKENSLTTFQWIKVFIIYCSLIYISMGKYSISIVFCSFLSFFSYWFSISLLYNLIVLAGKKIYDWLYDVSNSKARKPKTNKKLNVSKLTLLWTIIVFILGIIFNIKK